MPARIRPSVLFPAPFSPQSAWQVPAATSRVTSSSASAPGNRRVTPSKRTAGSLMAPRRSARQVLRRHVGEPPRLELARPFPEVLLADPDQLHRDDRGRLLLVVELLHDRLHPDISPRVDELGQRPRHHAL